MPPSRSHARSYILDVICISSAGNDESKVASPSTSDRLAIAPYSSVTRATIEAHSQAPPPSAEESSDMPAELLPRLSTPNLVVEQPLQSIEAPPQLPPPRVDPETTLDEWEMCYKDLTLREAVGWGKFGLVLLGVLLKGGHSRKVAQPVDASRREQDHSKQSTLVAVKRLRGWFTSASFIMLLYIIIYSHQYRHASVNLISCTYIIIMTVLIACILY